MIETFPTTIKFRDTDSCKKCGHCGKIWREPEGMTDKRYFFNLSNYNKIDLMDYIVKKDKHKTINEWYVEDKYAICPYCGNFGESLTEDNYTEEVEKENLEQIYLYIYNKKQDFESLVDVYRYYEYKKDYEKSKYYRTLIIECLKQEQQEEPIGITMMRIADLYRRNEEYDKALQTIKDLKKFLKSNLFEDKILFKITKYKIKEIKKYCKIKDSNKIDTSPETVESKALHI